MSNQELLKILKDGLIADMNEEDMSVGLYSIGKITQDEIAFIEEYEGIRVVQVINKWSAVISFEEKLFLVFVNKETEKWDVKELFKLSRY